MRDQPLLTKEEELALGRRIAAGSSDVIDRLVLSNVRFLYGIAAPYRGMGLPIEDLIHEGTLGLITAAHRYDHTKGVKFITYAAWWVRKSILEALSRQSLVRIPSNQIKKYHRLKAEMEGEHQRHDPADQKPDGDCPYCRIGPAHPMKATLSLDSSSCEDRLKDESAVDPERASLSRECLGRLGEGMSHLTDRERRILAMRFGLDGDGESTLREIGDAMGLSRERIRQLEQTALEKLRARVIYGRRYTNRPRRSWAAGPSRRRRDLGSGSLGSP